MQKIISDTFSYQDILEIIDQDVPFLRHKLDELMVKYRRFVMKTKPKEKKTFAPILFKSNRGLDYRVTFTTFGYAEFKKKGLAITIHAYYLKSEGFYLVSFFGIGGQYLLDNPQHVFFTPHFFDRFKERTGLPVEMTKLEVMNTFLNRNHQALVSKQDNPSYPNGIFGVYDDGVGLGKELDDVNLEMKTFVTFEMLRGEQIGKKEFQADMLSEYKELVYNMSSRKRLN